MASNTYFLGVAFGQPAGCDRVLGSDARLDECGVCNGDNSTCTRKIGTVSKPVEWGRWLIQSGLSKENTLAPKATVRSREVSASERVQLQRDKCISAGTIFAVRFREVSASERVQLQRDKCNSAGTKFAVHLREVSALESVRLERVDCIS